MKKTELETQRRIVALLNEGKTQEEVAAETGVKQWTVSRIREAYEKADLIKPKVPKGSAWRMTTKELKDLEGRIGKAIKALAFKHSPRDNDTFLDAMQRARISIATMPPGQTDSYYTTAAKWAICGGEKRENSRLEAIGRHTEGVTDGS